MAKVFGQCLILCLPIAIGAFDTSIFQQTESVVSTVLNIFESNFTLLRNDDGYPNGRDSLNAQWNDEICLQQFNSIFSGLNNSELWAIKLFDAWGKIPSGILYGNGYELGQFDECLSIEKPADNESTNALKGQYCLTQINIQSSAASSRIFEEIGDNRQLKKENQFKGTGARLMPTQGAESLGLKVGICVPDSCSPERMTEIMNYALNASNVSAMALVSDDFCQTNVKDELNTLDIFTIAFFGIIALLMVASTIYDLLTTQNKQNRRIGLTAFSVYSNAQKIFHCKKSSSQDAIDCLNGIRVLSIVWVIFGHAHMIFAMGPLLNPGYILQWMTQLYSMLLISATVSVDSFFLLSGLLVAWSTLKHLDKNNGKLNIFLFYFHRYIRLTPPLAALVLLSASLIRHLGSGPLWKMFVSATADKPCQQNWWSTLLYVQNYVNPTQMCLGHSWYLAVDTQLFVLSPILVYPLWRWRRKFVWIIPILISLSMGCVFSIFMIYHYSAQAMSRMMDSGTEPTIERLKSRNPPISTARNLLINEFDPKIVWKELWTVSGKSSPIFDFERHSASSREFHLQRKMWCNLNRLRTKHGRCNEMMFKWNLRTDPSCDCGNDHQSTTHLLLECPIYKYCGEISDIINLTVDALEWLRKLKL